MAKLLKQGQTTFLRTIGLVTVDQNRKAASIAAEEQKQRKWNRKVAEPAFDLGVRSSTRVRSSKAATLPQLWYRPVSMVNYKFVYYGTVLKPFRCRDVLSYYQISGYLPRYPTLGTIYITYLICRLYLRMPAVPFMSTTMITL